MDSRASIKIEFEIYDKKFKTELNINWYAEDNGIDSRVADWFSDKALEAEIEHDSNITRRKEENSRAIELKELERLKQKYEPNAL